MLVVHHLDNSRSQRVLWLLEELEVPYEIKHYQRDQATMLAPASLRAVHRLGKSPVITDGPVTLAESGAILEYLIDRHGEGRLRPSTSPERLRYTYWMHYAEGSAMPPLVMKLVFDRLEGKAVPWLARGAARLIARKVKAVFVLPQIALHLDYLEAELAKTTWFAGDAFTAADIQMSFPVQSAVALAVLDLRRPLLMGFIDRIRARPAYQRAVVKGGPFALG